MVKQPVAALLLGSAMEPPGVPMAATTAGGAHSSGAYRIAHDAQKWRPPPNASTTGRNAAAWQHFKAIDADCSGYLDEKELLQMWAA